MSGAGEIILGNVFCKHKGKAVVFEKVVHTVGVEHFSRKRYLDSKKIKEPLKIDKIEVLKVLGKVNKL